MEKSCGNCGFFSQDKIACTEDTDLGHCVWPPPWELMSKHFAEYCRKLGTPVVWKTDGAECGAWFPVFVAWIKEVKALLLKGIGLAVEPANFLDEEDFKKGYYDKGVMPADVAACEAGEAR